MVYRIIPLLLAIAIATFPVALFAGSQTMTQNWDGRKAIRSQALMRETVMRAHNQARKIYGSRPLIWDERLASDARAYARTLARSHTFEHDPQYGANDPQGENLWMGTRGAFTYGTMVGDWIDERRYFRPGRFPNVSRSGDWSMVGHYTQVVWPTTTAVGCAVVSNASDDYLVCRYFPAGNVMNVAMR